LPGIRKQAEREPPWADHLGGGNADLGAGWILAKWIVVAADQAGRPQDGQCQLAAVDELVFRDMIQEDRRPRDMDEAVGRARRRRNLPVAGLAGQPAIDDRELALG